ncbi:MAG TPA: calcium-binding protein, partial [Rhizomicrobium sp.]|nr:calcium-binding protein [Rhizomicrobium sp.]
MSTINGTPANDTLTGTAGDDTFRLFQGGEDTVSGQGGNDVFQFGATLDSGDTIDGGAGNDVIQIAGDYATTPLTFSATSLTGVEKIQLGAGFNYDLTTDDANVAAGQTLTIDGGNLGSGNHLDFNGAAETDGNFVIVGGAAGDDITTGAGNDTFKLAAGGNDSVEAGDGKDVFIMGASLDANDSLDGGFDGGNPHNVIRLDGDYSAGLTLGAGTIQDIYTFQFAAGHSYKIVADAATFLSGPAVSIQGGNLGAGDSLTFDNSASDANLHFTGGAGNDTAIGGDAQNTFDLAAGGNDTATGGALTDHFRMGSAFTASDRIDGGGGFDVVSLDGMGTQDVIVFNATTMVNVESLQLAAGFDYSLTTDDATVASGATLIVDAHTLGAANSLTFDGSAESDGSFVLRGGAGNDTLTGGARADTFNLTAGGDDTASGGGGNDTFNLGGTFTASDAIDGGTGNDTAVLQGMGDDSIFFTASTMTNVETLVLDGGHHYDLVTADATVAAGKTLTVDASALGAGDTMDFDGSAETNGNFHIIAGAGPYELIGGGGGDEFDVGGALTAADSIDGGGGNDIVAMNGDYAGAHALVLDATTLTNITQIALFAGHSYDLTTDDATVAAGHALTINGSTLGAADSFTFDGAAETDGTFSITGGAGDNVLTGGAGADYFDIENGGNDTVHGGGGDDSVFASNELTAADTIDGGAGNDTVELQGDYTGGKALVLGATTMTNVETLQLDTGSSYDITTNDATVAAGQTLTVDASALGAGDTLTFNGAAETDGALSFLLGAHFTAADSITGGVEGYDTIYLDGDYSAGLTFGASTITDIEDIVLGAGHGYNLTTNDANVELGGTLTIDARALGAGDNLTFNGGAETNGGFIIYAGAGNDTLTGGAGFDIFNMGAHLTAADTIDGGGGGNSVYLDGDYSAGVTFGASTMTDISAIVLATGYGYNLTTNDATVAAGMTLTVEDYSTDNVTFNGSAETNGSFDIFAAEGNDTLTGGAGNDAFFMADNLTAADTIDGGAGNDTVELYGDYSAGLTLAASTITNVETLKLGDGFSYKLTTNDGNVASGATMAVDASALTGTNALTFDGSAENGGFYAITGGAGDDSVTYGSHFSASDSFDGGGGNDTLVLTNVQGNYFFADTTMHSVEDLVITPQTASVLLIVTTDANVAAGATLTVDFSNLNPGDNPSESFDGEAETDGHFAFIAPSGGTGSVVFDYTGGAQSDTLSYTHSLNVAAAVFNGMGGDDVVTTTASASTLEFNGGTGNDTLAFTGGGTENQAYYLSSVENVAFDDNNWNVVASFNLDVAGGSVNIDATALSGGHTLSFNGADVYNHGNASFVFEFGGNFGIGDTLTGGAYDDVLSLDGDYSSLYIFGSSQLTSIETIRVADGHTYDLQMGDGTVAAGATLTVDASALTGSNRIAFDGSLEQDGHFAFIGGAGPDSLVGGMQSDTFDFSLTNGADAAGFGGNDTFTFTTAANLLSVQFIDGGTGSDTLILDGDFSTQTAVTSLHFNSIEALQLLGGTNSYNLSFADGITTALAVDASAASSLTFDARGNTTTTFTITGSAGDDVVKFAGNFTVSDTFNGGAGNDTLTLDGDYSGGLTLGASMIASVEKIAVGDGFSYELVADDANVAAGATLTVDASALTGTNTLDFSGADETDGHFAFISGAGNDALEGGAQSDTFDLSLSGGAFASGNGGNDSFTVTTAAHLLSDDIIGGTGTDTLILNGDFSTQTALTGSNLNSVEALTLLGGGNSYNLTFADGITT